MCIVEDNGRGILRSAKGLTVVLLSQSFKLNIGLPPLFVIKCQIVHLQPERSI